MKIDSLTGVVCEGIAFAAWAIQYKGLKEGKLKLFTIYLGIIWTTEMANLIFWISNESLTNIIVNNFNSLLQFIFFFYFFLVEDRKNKSVFIILSLLLLTVFCVEKGGWTVSPLYFPSLAFGCGSLLLTGVIIYKTIFYFNNPKQYTYNINLYHIIFIGVILFYVGGFPYQNFRNYFWSHKSMYPTAYLLHYITQFFCYCMYLLFALSIKWRIK
jgi:hypothetical protein